jgi:hypothetical protein
MAMDAFHAVENRVMGRFAYFETSAEPWSGLSLNTQFAQYRFSDDVVRNSVRMEALRRVRRGRRLRLDLGGAGNFLWNDRPTDDFYSPSSFHSLLGEVQPSGHLSSRLEYSTEFGAGAQSEAGYPVQSPLIAHRHLIRAPLAPPHAAFGWRPQHLLAGAHQPRTALL